MAGEESLAVHAVGSILRVLNQRIYKVRMWEVLKKFYNQS